MTKANETFDRLHKHIWSNKSLIKDMEKNKSTAIMPSTLLYGGVLSYISTSLMPSQVIPSVMSLHYTRFLILTINICFCFFLYILVIINIKVIILPYSKIIHRRLVKASKRKCGIMVSAVQMLCTKVVCWWKDKYPSECISDCD